MASAAVRRERPTAFPLVRAVLVGATGIEPVTSSVSAKHREALCQEPSSQVAADRRCGRERSGAVKGNALFRHSPPPLLHMLPTSGAHESLYEAIHRLDVPYPRSGHRKDAALINGAHAIPYSDAADATRATLAKILGTRSVDAGGGWLIFALPPAEIAVHPATEGGGAELYLMTDDVAATVAALQAEGLVRKQTARGPSASGLLYSRRWPPRAYVMPTHARARCRAREPHRPRLGSSRLRPSALSSARREFRSMRSGR